MAEFTGLAGGIAQGFQLGNNFFSTIDQRQRQNVQDQRNAELFKMQQDQFAMQKDANNLTNELNQIKVNQAKSQLDAKQEVGKLSTLMNDVLMGADPNTVVDRLDALNIDLTPLVDRTLKSAIDDLGQGKYDSANPSHTDAINFLMGPKVQQVKGMTAKNGEKIAEVRVVDIVPSPTNPEMLVPELAVKTESGLTYRAPITQNRTANPDDPIVQISMDAAIQKAMGTRQLYQFLDRDDIRTVVQNRINQISAPYTQIEGGIAFNALTGAYEDLRPPKPTQPTKGSLAVLAAQGDSEAANALQFMNQSSINTATELAIAMSQETDPIERQKMQNTLEIIAQVEAKARAQETAAAFSATSKLQVDQKTALLLEEDRLGQIKGQRDELIDRRQQFATSAQDLAQVTADFQALEQTNFQGDPLSEFTEKIDRLLIAANVKISNQRQQQLARMGNFRASAVKLGLLGLSYFKGAISEKELETAMQLAPKLNNLNDVNRWIIKSATSSNAVGRMLVSHQLDILNSNKTSQQRIQEHDQFVDRYGSLPTIGNVAYGNNQTEIRLFSDFYPEYVNHLRNHQDGDKTKGLSKKEVQRLVMDGWLKSISTAGGL